MIDIKIEGLDALTSKLDDFGKRQLPYALSRTLNVVGKKIVEAENGAIASVFDRPTPRTQQAVALFKSANKRDNPMEVVIGIKDGEARNDGTIRAGGKGSIYPAQYLAPEVYGGRRVPKRLEKRLQRAGVMPSGMVAVYAKRSNALDAYGNLSQAKIVQILSWFDSFNEAGYKANMSASTKEKMRSGKHRAKLYGQDRRMKWGMAYFRGGPGTGLPDGIWERHYPQGRNGKSFIRPILIYVASATYTPRFRFFEIGQEVAQREIQPTFSTMFDEAMRAAK